ncbi:olfactory receptor class A-like protein 1 [Protopterus annectens]|uniref:olfactory receptor class A-like protein 1 n=1 Tax=Protopterus annectens TaxID=7888 RepID=UPI001CFB3D59|nr:olfactory receptor class A-like protein 1 [Protopterus annectens]
METRLILKATGFIFLLVIGIPANVTVLVAFLLSGIYDTKLLPTDIILTKLTFVNLVVVLLRGFPQTLIAIRKKVLFDDYGCKLLIFTYRVFRAMSICITSVLSCYQCIILLPPSSRWIVLKQKFSHNILPVFLILWCINCIIDIPDGLVYTCAPINSTIPKYTLNLEFCLVVFPHYFSYVTNGVAYSIRDFSFIGMMAFASGYIVTMLYRHNKQVQGIRNSDQKQGNTVETRAAKAVVLLVTVYIILFGIDNFIWMYTMTVSNVAPAVSDVRVFVALLYTSVSPMIIIGTNKKIQLRLKCVFLVSERNIQENIRVASNKCMKN